MAYDKNTSPIGWYVGSYLARFIEIKDEANGDPDAKFLAWENTVLVRACSLDEAYKKVERIGKKHGMSYKGGPEGVPVRWEYLGITQLLPVYEEMEDGSEIMWAEHVGRKFKTLKKWVKPKGSFRQ